jgi:hypothetical protein
LTAGEFISVESVTSGLKEVYVVPNWSFFGVHDLCDSSAWTPADVQEHRWDFNGDGIQDYVVAYDWNGLARLMIGIKNAQGHVAGSHAIVLPNTVVELQTSDPSKLQFVAGSMPGGEGGPQDAFWPVAGAPGVGLAQLPGNINADTGGDDALVLVDNLDGSIAIHVGINNGSGVYQWQTPVLIGPSFGTVQSFALRDLDGDDDLDLLFGVLDEEDNDIYRACFFDGGTFVAWDGPLLILEGARFSINEPIQSVFELRAEVELPENVRIVGYVMGLSGSGTAPGFNYQSVRIPLNDDAFLEQTLLLGSSPYTQNFQDRFDHSLVAWAELRLPAGFPSAMTLYAAYLTYEATPKGSGAVLQASNAVRIRIVPE